MRKILFLTDVVSGGGSGSAVRKVGEILEQTPRQQSSFARITVSHGIFLDPEHPGEAVVYALVMDDRELKELRSALEQSFPGGLVEEESRPEVVTQLADVGQFSVHAGTPVAGLLAVSDEPKRAIRAEDHDPLLNIRNPDHERRLHRPSGPLEAPPARDDGSEPSAPSPTLRGRDRSGASHDADARHEELVTTDLRPRQGASVVLLLVRSVGAGDARIGPRD